MVKGTSTGLAGGQVQAMVRLAGQRTYAQRAVRPIDEAGRFTWSRSTPKRVSIYFTSGGIASNRISIPSR